MRDLGGKLTTRQMRGEKHKTNLFQRLLLNEVSDAESVALFTRKDGNDEVLEK